MYNLWANEFPRYLSLIWVLDGYTYIAQHPGLEASTAVALTLSSRNIPYSAPEGSTVDMHIIH